MQAKPFEGIGAARILRAGARFSPIDHASYGANTTAFDYAGALLASHDRDDNAFTVLVVEHEASNDLGNEAARLLGHGTMENGTYKNRFECVLAAVPVVPPHVAAPTAPGALSAIVVGIDDSVVSAERGHRVKVQMYFQRGERPDPGGRPTGFGEDAQANAPGDDRSGTWVRVGGPVAGANWGALYTPRIGPEVTVQFIDGHIDRPVIVGGLYGGADAMPSRLASAPASAARA
jgi:type VI secretion system secreted protein VgrG